MPTTDRIQSQHATDLCRFAALCAHPQRTQDHAAWSLRWEAFCEEIGEDRYNAASYAYEMHFDHQQDRAYSSWEGEQR